MNTIMKLSKFINYKFIYKHKLILGILLIILGVFLSYNPIIEGLSATIGKYEFLAPPTDNISDDMWQKLLDKYKKIEPYYNSMERVKKTFNGNISNKEITYFLEHGKFPLSPYILERIQEKYPDLKDIFEMGTTRVLYSQFFMNEDSIKTPPPDEYLIFIGKKSPSTKSEPTYSINKSTTSLTDDIIPPENDLVNNKNYNDFISLCKRVK